MKLYRISIYDSASIWSALIGREYTYYTSKQEAVSRAVSLCKKPEWHYTVHEVQSIAER